MMPFIHFAAIKAEKLAITVALIIVALSVICFLAITNSRMATPLPKAALWPAVPVIVDNRSEPAFMQLGAAAPSFTLDTPSGASISLETRRGRPVLLYFWASWCSFCRDDMPVLQALYDQNKEAGLEVLAIDVLEQAGQVAEFGRQLGLRYPLLLDTQASVCQMYLVKATPTYIFIDRDGVVRSQLVGRPTDAVFQANLSLIINKDAGEAASEGT